MKTVINSKIISNVQIAPDIFSMRLYAPEIVANAIPGQFVQLYINDGAMLLPRPISICDCEEHIGVLRIVYQVVGKGTDWLSKLNKNDMVKIMGPLGNGFTIDESKEKLVVGGGIGLPPLLYLCRKILKDTPDCKINVFAGFRSNPILIDEFKALCVGINVATDDGSYGFKGNVVKLLEKKDASAKQMLCCGPYIMLKNAYIFAENKNISCQVSMEEKMACGVGACLGCVVKLADGTSPDGFVHKRVCHDGPVFNGSEVLWNE